MAVADVKIVVSRNGNVLSSDFVTKSGDAAVDKSIQRALDQVERVEIASLPVRVLRRQKNLLPQIRSSSQTIRRMKTPCPMTNNKFSMSLALLAACSLTAPAQTPPGSLPFQPLDFLVRRLQLSLQHRDQFDHSIDRNPPGANILLELLNVHASLIINLEKSPNTSFRVWTATLSWGCLSVMPAGTPSAAGRRLRS